MRSGIQQLMKMTMTRKSILMAFFLYCMRSDSTLTTVVPTGRRSHSLKMRMA